jgi:energy-coupling factor transporter ATP-binding protein EcfA2
VEIVRGINAEGIAVIWIEHVVRALTSLVSRMTCLYGGEFIGDGTPEQVLANPRVREIYFGSDPDLSVAQALGTVPLDTGPLDTGPLENGPEKKESNE